ncbi:hypothetical protein GCM10023115_04800 [Pontixanthobacter gangjinensis]|uniref:UrcA family protein n=1 Tax=Pontixanthobacter gangjinensis TaxID=1028742 RepID=A0A6I4SLS7_9SPHN|nr:UrcA family protein [Pontixanthobacter gangjinensis]MXO55732.1 UrcA family protein [Pontixanthobacter gangjinensis]
MKKSLIALAAVGAMMSTTPAFAGNVQIQYDDLNLSSPAGQEALERRIDKAARDVCGLDQQRSGTRFPNRGAKKCFDNAKKQATQQMAAVVDEQRLGG